MQPLSFAARFGFAFVAFFRALFDGAFAARALAVKDSMPALPKAPRVIEAPKVDAHEERVRGALLLLELLQREGRLVDFSEQDIAKFSDADVGAAARLVHDGCRKALRAHVPVTPIRSEDEGSRLEDVRVGAEIKLVGEVSGKGPFTGALRHKGWRAGDVSLPEPTREHDARVLAPAEIEL